MRTSITKERARSYFTHSPRPHGFTLIEILIVLVVIGIAIALVSVNFRTDPKAALRDEAKRLALLLQAARTEAISTGKSLAWIAGSSGYGFYKRDKDRHWTVEFNEPPLGRGTFPSQVSVADLLISGARVPIATPLVFSSSGLNNAFQVELASGVERIIVIGEPGGDIRSDEITNTTEAAK